MWAKPRTNKNPLEKTGAAHGIGQGGESIGRVPFDNVLQVAVAADHLPFPHVDLCCQFRTLAVNRAMLRVKTCILLMPGP